MAMTKITFEDLPNTNTPINASNLNAVQDNVETAINSGDSGTVTEVETWVKSATGLGATTKTLDGVNINTIDNSTFAYLANCNYGGTTIDNGYLVNIVYTANYKLQVYFQVNGGGLQYRRCVNGSWASWLKLEESTTGLTSYFKNNWSQNGTCVAKKTGDNYKEITVSCRNGTSTVVMQLPSAYYPAETVILPATNFANSGYVIISTSGEITVSSNIYTSGASNLAFSGSYM